MTKVSSTLSNLSILGTLCRKNVSGSVAVQGVSGAIVESGASTDLQDLDGNTYTEVTIGTLTWLVENLKTTKYADGTPIPNVTDPATWAALTTGAYNWYNSDITNKTAYGALYNGFVLSNAKGLAAITKGGTLQTGWRVAAYVDFATLVAYLDGILLAGGKLKETGLTYWNTPNAGADNSVEWYGRGGGVIMDTGYSLLQKVFGMWWSNTEESGNKHWRMYLTSTNSWSIIEVIADVFGHSVRLVKDASEEDDNLLNSDGTPIMNEDGSLILTQ